MKTLNKVVVNGLALLFFVLPATSVAQDSHNWSSVVQAAKSSHFKSRFYPSHPLYRVLRKQGIYLATNGRFKTLDKQKLVRLVENRFPGGSGAFNRTKKLAKDKIDKLIHSPQVRKWIEAGKQKLELSE